jgi:hypothetical protein
MEKNRKFIFSSRLCTYDELAADFVQKNSLPQRFQCNICVSEKQKLILSQQFQLLQLNTTYSVLIEEQ